MKKILILVTLSLLSFQIINAQINTKKYVIDLKLDYSSKKTYEPIYNFGNVPLNINEIKPFINYNYKISPSFGKILNKNLILGLNVEYNYMQEGLYYNYISAPSIVGIDGSQNTKTYSINKQIAASIFGKCYYQFEGKFIIGANGFITYAKKENWLMNDKQKAELKYYNSNNYINFLIEPELQYLILPNFSIKTGFNMFTNTNILNSDYPYEKDITTFSLLPKNLTWGLSYYLGNKN